MMTSISAEELHDHIKALDLDVVERHFDQDEDEIEPYLICEGVSVDTFNKYVGDGEGLHIPLRFLEFHDGRVLTVELPSTVRESTTRVFESEFLTATGNPREIGKRGSMAASNEELPNKEADATFGPMGSTPHQTPPPPKLDFESWVTLAVEVGRTQSWLSLVDAAEWWCTYPGIQYILLLKVNEDGTDMAYALYDITVPGLSLLTPIVAGRFYEHDPQPQPVIHCLFRHASHFVNPCECHSSSGREPNISCRSASCDGARHQEPTQELILRHRLSYRQFPLAHCVSQDVVDSSSTPSEAHVSYRLSFDKSIACF